MILALCSSLGVTSCRDSSKDWSEVKEWVRSEFPEVSHVSVEELARALESKDGRPILLDVREKEEHAVSHLPGAVRVPPGSGGEGVEALAGVPRDAPIVAYCSVGYRSSQLAAALRARGFTNVRNLEGSIFEWANRGMPVERNGTEVDEVHPYDDDWGRLLNPELHAYEPGPSREP